MRQSRFNIFFISLLQISILANIHTQLSKFYFARMSSEIHYKSKLLLYEIMLISISMRNTSEITIKVCKRSHITIKKDLIQECNSENCFIERRKYGIHNR